MFHPFVDLLFFSKMQKLLRKKPDCISDWMDGVLDRSTIFLAPAAIAQRG
jgi:hypothetical protein